MKQYVRSNGAGVEVGNRDFGNGARDKSRDHVNKLFLGNLPHSADDVAIREWVEGFGYNVATVDIRRDPDTNRHRGFGFVKLTGANMDEGVLMAAAREIDGNELQGRKITCNLARPKK